MKSDASCYHEMLRIRRFEEKVLNLFSENRVSGTTHTYIGQEATAVSLMEHIQDGDIVFSNHRCHGQFLAYGGPMKLLFSEIMAKEAGVCKGIGGSQHIHYRNFYSNGVQGGIVPNAAGMAWAERLNGTSNIAAVFLGDGTLGQGVAYETFNMAALYKLPVLFIIEDNGYAMTTRASEGVSGDMASRPRAFGIETAEVTSNDAHILSEAFANAVSYVRGQKKPFCQVVHTYRLAAHSKGDDTRPAEEIAAHKGNDPLLVMGARISEEEKEQISRQVDLEIEEALSFAQAQDIHIIHPDAATDYHTSPCEGSVLNTTDQRCASSLNAALDELLSGNPDILLLGEDICDPYGGCFKVTKSLSTKHPKQVINTPISEAGMIGAGVGLALNHKRPVIEMMFGDFLTLGFDQILNHAAKYRWMYADAVEVPLVIRAPMGAGRGYGPTHSQSIEKFFVGIPELTTVALSPVFDSGALLKRVLTYTSSPVLFVENKKMYGEKLHILKDHCIGYFHVEETGGLFPTVRLSLESGSRPDAAVIAYGGMVNPAMQAASTLLMEHEILLDVIVPSQLSPYPVDAIEQFTEGTPVVGTLEEGTGCMGWGAEMIARLAERANHKEKFFRAAARDLPIPCSVKLEEAVLPSADTLIKKVLEQISL